MIAGTGLTFLAAKKLSKKSFKTSKKLNLLSSCLVDQIGLFFQGESALRRAKLEVELLPYGQLRQHFYEICNIVHEDTDSSVLFLFPWDFCPALDWRQGGPSELVNLNKVKGDMLSFFQLIEQTKIKHIYYFLTPLLPAAQNSAELHKINSEIIKLNQLLNSVIVPEEFVSIDSFLVHGSPLAGQHLGALAKMIYNDLAVASGEPKKVIVTDLDGTLWRGVLGEDGVDGIYALPEGNSSIHFTYQVALKRYKNAGVIMAVVSKNDKDLVENSFRNNTFPLGYEDFVCVFASYQPKSLQIKQLSENMNIGLEHFVFIDDNPIELEEVRKSLPEVSCLKFGKNGTDLVQLLSNLALLFPINRITAEDKVRTELYRSRAMSQIPVKGSAADLSDFLKSLKMELTVRRRDISDMARAVQLINKTNQFNLNGVRRTEVEIAELLADGANLYTGELSDINGVHGETLVALIDKDGCLLSFVMSCRVFQRRVEFVFIAYLVKQQRRNIKIRLKKTARNEPFSIFLNEVFGEAESVNRTINLELASSLLMASAVYFNKVQGLST